MKRFLIICAGLFCAAITLKGQQSPEIKTEGGIKADVTFFNFLKKDAPGAISTLTPGGTLGGFMNIWFHEHIGIQPQLNLNFKQTVMGWDKSNGKMQSFGIEVPIYVMGRFKAFGNHHVLIGLGPYTEFSCHAVWKIDGRKVDLLEIHEDGKPMIQDTQSGFGAVLGYEFANGIAIDISYRLCCYNILQPNSSQGVSLYPQTISLGLAYKFMKR